MAGRDGVLLTGATGLLGRYLLRELTRAGHRVAVLVRPGRASDPAERIRDVIAFEGRPAGKPLPGPTVLAGDLRDPGAGLSAADRAWLGRRCRAVVHAAASVSFQTRAGEELRATNVEGTRRLVQVCAAAGIADFHHVSTAFVCGTRSGPIRESDLDCGQDFHNDYERSKHDAEQLLRAAPGLRPTVYRPAVIVGDSRTGYTSTYHGCYRFLELADRLARPGEEPGARRLPLRLPFDGDERRDLVPVDWVAAGVARIVGRPALHGRTYHLTSPDPIRVAEIKSIAERELGLGGVELAGPGPVPRPTDLDRAFLAGIREYWPYLGSDPVFDRRNTLAALPDLPAPRVDAAVFGRLIRFARADGWGRRRHQAHRPAEVDCGAYIERYFPAALAGSEIARVPVEAALGFEVRGPGGGRWVCHIGGGRVAAVHAGSLGGAEVVYRMDVATFAAVVAGRESPQAAFFGRRIEIAGRVEKGLKLAVLFDRFVRAFPYPLTETPEPAHAAAGR